MKVASCLVVGAKVPVHATAARVARTEFPGAKVTALDTLDEALQSKTPRGLELLVLADTDLADLARAENAVDPTGLPRWAVVVLKGNAITVNEDAAGKKWTVDLLALAFRSAVVQHELRRDNLRLRGDLCTVARRITHDLRTPLGGILNTTQALREVLAEHDPAGSELAKPLVDSVRHMNQLMDRVSLLAKASANQSSSVPVAMGGVIARVMQRFELQILRTGAIVEKREEWPEVDGVPEWLEIAWSELVANALQYGGEPARVELGWDESDGEFRFWVLNRRGSVPREKLRNLFQPFHLLHQLNAKRGLGLSIVQRLLELQGGTCGCEPLAGDGTIFLFTLPKGSGSTSANNHPAASDAARAAPLESMAPNRIVSQNCA
jgi:signal transduction histidine kinase